MLAAFIIFPDRDGLQVILKLGIGKGFLNAIFNVRLMELMVNEREYAFALVIGAHTHQIHIDQLVLFHGSHDVNKAKGK